MLCIYNLTYDKQCFVLDEIIRDYLVTRSGLIGNKAIINLQTQLTYDNQDNQQHKNWYEVQYLFDKRL